MLRAYPVLTSLALVTVTILASGCGRPVATAKPKEDGTKVDEIDLRLNAKGSAFESPTQTIKPAQVHRDEPGEAWAEFITPKGFEMTDALTVEAWVTADRPSAAGMETVVAQWRHPEAPGPFRAVDAGKTAGLDTSGFLGAVFDGRYVYFAPQHNAERRHGRALRYDTHKPLDDPKAWEGYDAEQTGGMLCQGYYGAAFDGRFVYFTPRRNVHGFHSRALRYDTRKPFTDPAAWDAHDAGLEVSYQGCAYDGRYLYFCPGYGKGSRLSGLVLRYDTKGGFDAPASWRTFDAASAVGPKGVCFDGACFDGRYIYLAPLAEGGVLRYDTSADFEGPKSWSLHDISRLGVVRCVGAVFDGRYVYMVPYGKTRVVVRYDTTAPFEDDKAWEARDVAGVNGLYTIGYDGAAFDGRYVHFIPFWDEEGRFHANFLRYDTQKPFESPEAWSATDASRTDGLKTIGYNGGAFDGRYLYAAPWHDGTGYPERIIGHGRVLRYDTVGGNGVFCLRWSDCGDNGSLCAAVPGPTFLINTDRGPRSVSAHRVLPPGRRHLAGVYDGRSLRLYVDGELVAEREASGALLRAALPIAIGRMDGGRGFFRGTVHEVRISNRAKTADEIRRAAQTRP